MDPSDIDHILDEDEQKELKEEFGIELLEKIDEGSFGVVFKGRDLSDKSLCAVKVTQNNKEKYTSIETSILRGLDHPNIVKFKKFIELESNKLIVMEFIGCGTLQQLIEKRKANNTPFSESEISTIMNHLVQALKCMHENNVLHRDIKPENILLASKEDLSQLKVSDFGLSVKYQDGVPFKSYSQRCGTVIFMAPEILAEKQYSKPVDIWSCGIILYMLFTMGKHPFKSSGDSREDYIKKLVSLDISKEEFDEGIFPSELAKDLMIRMLNKEPSNRYTANQVLKHPFITRKLNSNIPLSFQESARVFQNERKLGQTIKAILLLQYIQSKSVKMQEHQQQHHHSKTVGAKLKVSPLKYKSFEDKESPITERSALANNRKVFIGNEDSQTKVLYQIDSTPNLDLLRIDSPSRQFRLNSSSTNDKNHKLNKLKLAIPTDSKLNKSLSGQVKSLTSSPIQPNSAQSKDGQQPAQKSNNNIYQSQNSHSKFYAESPNSANQKLVLPLISVGKQSTSSNQSTPLFFGKKDNLSTGYSPSSSTNQIKNPPSSSKLSSHGQNAQRISIQQMNGGQNQPTSMHMKTNSLQRPIQTPTHSQTQNSTSNLSNTVKSVRKSSQNFQIKVINNPHNTSSHSINTSTTISNSTNTIAGAMILQPQNDLSKQRGDKQLSFHKNGIQVRQPSKDSISSNNSWSNKTPQNIKPSLKCNSQTTLSPSDSRPNTRQKDSYKPSQFSQVGFKDIDIISPQRGIHSQAFSFQNFPHNQRVLTESRKIIHKDSFDYLECEENI